MKVFESLLLFLRASRQQNWTLHLASLHDLPKYFFAYDMPNYARFTPVYLAQMYSLKNTDGSGDGNFSVNKLLTSFTALGAGHALDQANKTMKIHGGIKGIANNQISLDRYFIITPELYNIIDKFYSFFCNANSCEEENHYQLRGDNFACHQRRQN